VGTKEKLSSIGKPVPELPVADVERAQQHYRDALGFEIGGFTQTTKLGPCHAVMLGQYFFARGSRRSNLRFTGCSPKISMRRTRN
jgi:hypothetical protein